MKIQSGRLDPIGQTRPAPSWELRQASRETLARLRTLWHGLSIERRMLVILLGLFLTKGVAIAFIHPPFTGHDEVAHYAYLQVVATEFRVPIIPEPDIWKAPGAVANPDSFDRIPAYFWKYCQFSTQDWSGCGNNQCPDACYLHADKSSGTIMPAGWIYTANHPPLYYLLMTPLYWATAFLSPEAQLAWFRLAAIPLGMLTVLFAYLTTRTLFPRDRFLAIVVPALVAFEPQVSYEAAMLNNDILAICLTSAVIWMTAVGLRRQFPLWNCLTIGSLLGLALLAKTTSITVTALIAVGMVLGLGWRNWRRWAPRGAVTALTGAFIVWPWYVFMYRTYGDVNALSRIHTLQWWNYSTVKAPTILSQLTDRTFFWAIWGQTWGGFGWFLIPLSDGFLRRLLWVLIVAIAGLGVYAIRAGLSLSPTARCRMPRIATSLRVDRIQIVGLTMLGAMVVGSYAALLQFGTEFQGTQARYAFPAVTAVAMLVAVGFRAWVPRRWLQGVAAAIILGLIVVNVAIYTTYVIPWVVDHPGT